MTWSVGTMPGHTPNLKVAWFTDIHLDFASPQTLERFWVESNLADFDVVVITGDIGESDTLHGWLKLFEQHVSRPIYFVLGNHDYYGSSFQNVHAHLTQILRTSPWLTWLDTAEPVELGSGLGLIGVGGWSDGGYGSYDISPVRLSDWNYISDFAGLDHHTRGALLAKLGDQAAELLDHKLEFALRQFERLIVATHYPPFPEACLYMARPTDALHLPHFSCKAIGDRLLAAAGRRPDRDILVLCGHTHCWADTQILPNLRTLVGAADYGHPALQPLITV